MAGLRIVDAIILEMAGARSRERGSYSQNPNATRFETKSYGCNVSFPFHFRNAAPGIIAARLKQHDLSVRWDRQVEPGQHFSRCVARDAGVADSSRNSFCNEQTLDDRRNARSAPTP